MANQLYGYNPSGTAGIVAANTRSMEDYLSKDKTLLSSSTYFGSTAYSSYQTDTYSPTASRIPGYGPPGVDVTQPAAVTDSYFSSLKRSSSNGKRHSSSLCFILFV